MMVTIRLFAAARAAAGTSEILVPPGRLDDLIAALRAAQPPAFGRVLAISSLVSDGTRLDPAAQTLIPAGTVIDVLPPFAGG